MKTQRHAQRDFAHAEVWVGSDLELWGLGFHVKHDGDDRGSLSFVVVFGPLYVGIAGVGRK